MSYRNLLFAICLLISSTLIRAQQDAASLPKTVSWMFGYGNATTLETYLSPYKYSGTDYQLIGDVSRFSRGGKLFTQHTLNIEYAKSTDISGRGLYYLGMLDYSYGRHYGVLRNEDWKWLVGGAADLYGGAIYNIRNSNNPVQVKAVINLHIASRAEYSFKIKSFPINVVYQFKMPVLGVGFAPDYGASYYEMFQLNNTSGIIHIMSLHNQWAMQNLLTVELPLSSKTLRIGYSYNIYQTRINSLETSLISNSFLIGYSGDILSLDRRKKRE
jgi:hypothetical protein